ncbi:MAG: UvrABC system protein C (plasmid) [Chroococcopsis gigantea SAG 12.99]|jgi:predicted GIY-YIG superfamily endonuclease|nr:UvrABC system protein C [Chroococcopsis gigantea SAG 12.99]
MVSNFNFLKLPYVTLAERQQLPSCAAIYFAIDENDRILYVGKAKNLMTRWKNHHRLYKLQQLNQESPVRLAWQVCNEEDLSEIEKRLITEYQPLLNNTQVELPAVIPSEVVLREFLRAFSRKLIIAGIKPKTDEKLLKVHIIFDWRDASSKGTANRIKEFISANQDKNTSLKFKDHKFTKFRHFTGENLRPGSRALKTMARQHRSYNNHWELACNGVVIHITPTDRYGEYKDRTERVKIAGVNFRAVSPSIFTEGNKKSHELSSLSPYIHDPIPLFWVE